MNIEHIWQAYQSSLKAFLLKNVANPADVDDLLQDILIKSYQNLSKLKDSNKVKPWLFQIAQHSIIDFYRKNANKRDAFVDELTDMAIESESHLMSELSQCVLPFINALPEQEAQLLTAIDIEGIAQKQYAAEQGINYSTLKSQVQKSRQQLHQLFNNCCHFEIDNKGQLIDYQSKQRGCHNC